MDPLWGRAVLRGRNTLICISLHAPVISENKKSNESSMEPTTTTATGPTETIESMVEISIERLQALEALEAKLPSMIENAILEYKKSNLRRLHEKDKANPASVNARVKRYAEKHKDEINAKRREKRRLAKEAVAAQAQAPTLTAQAIHGLYVPFD